jgi:hypothetical protein
MSYTTSVKKEILTKEIEDSEEHLWEIYAILKGKIAIGENKIELKLENLELAKRVYKYLKELVNLKISIKYSISKRFGEHRIYIIEIPNQKGYKKLIKDIEELDKYTYEDMTDNSIMGFVRGTFLSTGYIKDPDKEYAMDFFIDSPETAEKLYEILVKLGKRAFITNKRNKKLVYLRNSEDIMDIVVLIGALQSFFAYEEVTMLKDIKNKTIREINWEIANETKTLNTAQKQIRMIEFIRENGGLGILSDVLLEMAEARLRHSEASLGELAEIIGLSKSGVRNRFRRIEEIYNELKEEILE